jgi:parvulin-like peptidyl-prolyl isomerase
MHIRVLTVSVAIFLFQSSSIISQGIDDERVAIVGTKEITVNEFIERFEFSPRLHKNDKSGVESAKLELIYSLIAEKLWAEESYLLGMDTLDVIKFSENEFKKIFVRDVLFKKEILDKVKILPEELTEGYFRNQNTLKINFIFSENENEIRNVHHLLMEGIHFDSLLTNREEFAEQQNPIEVVFGQMDESIEDSLFQLKIEEFTQPILTPDGWYIFKLTNRITSLFNQGESENDSRKSAEKIIRARKSRDLYFEYYQDFFSDKKVDVNKELFEKLAIKISERFEWQKIIYRTTEDKLFHLLAEDVVAIENEIGTDSLNMVFIEFETEPFSLKHYFRILAFDGFSSGECDSESIRKLLNTKTRQIIEYELLAREGIGKGYHLLPDVQDHINMWVDNYLFQVIQNKIMDSVIVSNDEIYSYYIRKNNEEKYPAVYNIREILVDSLDKVDIIFQEINSGKEFSDLAKKYTIREWTKDKGGEFGFFYSSQHGEIGKIAATMEVGDIYGPLKVPLGYSIFKLIDKRDSITIPPVPFEKVKDRYKRELLLAKTKSKITNYTVNLAVKFGVGLDFNVFNSIEVTNINSLGIRRLGFGGQITAVPIIAPNFDWVQQWLEKINVIQ